jgi:AraC-like DNA-binding protein
MRGLPAIQTDVDTVLPSVRSEWHHHDEHELLWPAAGTFQVETGNRSWLAGPGVGVWVPAGTRHRTAGQSGYSCGWALVPVDRCPQMWNQVSAVRVEPLLRNLLGHLALNLTSQERANAEAVVLDLLHRLLQSSSIEVPMPRDPRCRAIAERILAEPATAWELADWAAEVGAGTRTLARLFRAQTSMSFGRWRTQVRMRAAIGQLAVGRPVSVVARQVGYSTTSSFVAAFRRATGRTPGTYFPPDEFDAAGAHPAETARPLPAAS